MEDMKQSPVSGIRTGTDTDFIVQSEETVFRGGDDAQFEVICANVARADDGETSAEDASSPSYPSISHKSVAGSPAWYAWRSARTGESFWHSIGVSPRTRTNGNFRVASENLDLSLATPPNTN